MSREQGIDARGLSEVYVDIFLFAHPQLRTRGQNPGLKTSSLSTNHTGSVKPSMFLNPEVYGHVPGLCEKVLTECETPKDHFK